MDIARETRERLAIAVTTSLSTTAEIEFSNCVSGEIYIPAGATVTTLTWHTSPTRGGTYLAAYDSAATPAAVTQTVAASRAYPIPVALAGCAFIKAVGDAAVSIGLLAKT